MNSQYLGILQHKSAHWDFQTIFDGNMEKAGTFYLPHTSCFDLFDEISFSWNDGIITLALTIVNNVNVWMICS